MMNCYCSLIGVYNANRKDGTSFFSSLAQLFPIIMFSISTYFWLASPYSMVLKQEFIVFAVASGLTFGRIAVI